MDLIIQYLPSILHSLGITFLLVIPSLLLGFTIAFLLVWSHYQKLPFMTGFAAGYSFFIRGTPLLVQIFLLYYGCAQFSWIRNVSWLWYVLSTPMGCAILAFSLSTSAYTYELLKSAIYNVPVGYVDAAKTLGFSDKLLFRKILFPIAFRNLLPSYVNEITLVIKGSSLASTITVLDLMGMTQKIIGETYATVQFFVVASVLYLVINSLIMFIFHRIIRNKDNKKNNYERSQSSRSQSAFKRKGQTL